MSYQTAPSSNIIEQQLDKHLACLGSVLDADVLAFCGGILYGVDDIVRDSVERIEGKKTSWLLCLKLRAGLLRLPRE